MAGAFGCHQQRVDTLGGIDLAEVQVESVGAHEHIAWSKIRLDVRSIQIALDFVGKQNVDDVGIATRFVDLKRLEAMADGQIVVLATGALADDDLATAITQVLCLRMALGSIAQNRNGFVFENR